MKKLINAYILTITIIFISVAVKANNELEITSKPSGVISYFFENLKQGDLETAHTLFVKLPSIEKNKNVWLEALKKTSEAFQKNQIEWEVICDKELSGTSVVLVNQTKKNGKQHGDPDGAYLIKSGKHWRILPSNIFGGFEEDEEGVLTDLQLREKLELKRFVTKEIRGITNECHKSHS